MAGWRVPINVKLLAVLAVPVLGYTVIASAAVLRAQQAANRIRDQAGVVTTAVGPTSLTTSLIDERTLTMLEANDLQDRLTLRIGSLEEARRATDEELGALQTLVDENSEARRTYTAAVDGIAGGLDQLRTEADAGTADQAAVFERYGELIAALIDANAEAVERVSDAEFWQGAKLSELATRQKDARAVLVNALIPVSQDDGRLTDRDQTVEIVRALGTYENRDGAIHQIATGQYAQAGSVLVEALEAADLAELARKTLETRTLDQNELFDVASYKGGFVYDLPSGDYIHDFFRARVVEILDSNATERMAAADERLRTHALVGGVGLVITALITFLVSRSIIRPLRSLTTQVIDTANHRLPSTVQGILETPLGEDVAWPHLDPIQVQTADEVGDVAHAFNTMQQSALHLAVEEAILRRHITDSLVTLGQRNQSLLNRQISFITDLERNESDPETLTDLLYLDHLAVRMRRNAELLLVLAGVDPPRKWVGPTPIGEIIKAALGEAAEYKRVRVRDIEPAAIAGSATAELSHLMAELVENALLYSPPGDTVEIYGRHRSDDDDYVSDGYTVTVEDHGVGMTFDDLGAANRRLSASESSAIAPSKYMGHYIAGKLAARHGIIVRLHTNSPGDGLTATIDVPGRLLTPEAHASTVTQLPPLPPMAPELPVIPLPPSLPLSTLSPLPPLLTDVSSDDPVEPAPAAERPDSRGPRPAPAPPPADERPVARGRAAAGGSGSGSGPGPGSGSDARFAPGPSAVPPLPPERPHEWPAEDPAEMPPGEWSASAAGGDPGTGAGPGDPTGPVPLADPADQGSRKRPRRKRPLANSKLPVPPSNQTLGERSDSDQAS